MILILICPEGFTTNHYNFNPIKFPKVPGNLLSYSLCLVCKRTAEFDRSELCLFVFWRRSAPERHFPGNSKKEKNLKSYQKFYFHSFIEKVGIYTSILYFLAFGFFKTSLSQMINFWRLFRQEVLSHNIGRDCKGRKGGKDLESKAECLYIKGFIFFSLGTGKDFYQNATYT